jgi:methylenetetrahydrofolate reductase (NADPH)
MGPGGCRRARRRSRPEPRRRRPTERGYLVVSVSISFEVFPPKQPEGLARLAAVVTELQSVDPTFVSVTYGAGGSERQRSFDAIDAVRSTNAAVAGHLTCVGERRTDIEKVIDRYVALGVHEVVALRGDPPGGIEDVYVPHPEGFQSTADLVAAIKNRSNLKVAVSGYPERHPQSPSGEHDLDILADKVAAGAERAVTQMFFDNQHFFRYRDAVQRRGIDVAIVPGIFPIHSFRPVARFASQCGTSIPHRVADRFAGLGNDIATTHKIAAEIAAAQISELHDQGVEHVHLYTLNRSDLALAVCDLLDRTVDRES